MRALLLLIAFISLSAFGQTSSSSIEWLDLEEAIKRSQTNPKKILVKISTDWCFFCKKMENGTYTKEKVIDYINKNYYAVYLDGEEERDVVYKGTTYKYTKKEGKKRGYNEATLAITDNKLVGYPTLIVLDDEGNRISPLANYMKAGQLVDFLEKYRDK